MARAIYFVVSGLILLALTIQVSAQQTAAPGSSPDPLIRKEFRNSPELPDGIAFLTTMQLLESTNESSSDLAAGLVEDGMRLDNLEAQEFLALLLTTLESVEAEMTRKKHEVCLSSEPKNDQQAYATFQSLENVTEHVAAVRLHKLRAEIGPDKAQRLDQWLNKQKLTIQYVTYNRKEMYKRQGRDPNERLSAICSGLAKIQVGGAQ